MSVWFFFSFFLMKRSRCLAVIAAEWWMWVSTFLQRLGSIGGEVAQQRTARYTARCRRESNRRNMQWSACDCCFFIMMCIFHHANDTHHNIVVSWGKWARYLILKELSGFCFAHGEPAPCNYLVNDVQKLLAMLMMMLLYWCLSAFRAVWCK